MLKQVEEYCIENIGQYRAVAKELGISESYQGSGILVFQKEDQSIRTSFEKIRIFLEKNTHNLEEKQLASKNKVIDFFDMDQASNNFDEYKDFCKKNHNLSIVKWEKLKKKEDEYADGFTIIDHNEKVAYTGQSLYKHAIENNVLLNGQGAVLEEGDYSKLQSINGKKGKYYKSEKGYSVLYAKESLTIPNEMFGHKFSKEEKEKLKVGDIIYIKSRNTNLYLIVDKELNAVIVKGDKELGIPKKLGANKNFKYEGYELNDLDRILLANNKFTSEKLLAGEDGFFLAKIGITDDKKGVIFKNVESLTKVQAEEYMKKMQEQEVEHLAKENAKDTLLQEENIIPSSERQLNSEIEPSGNKEDVIQVDTISTGEVHKETIVQEGKEGETNMKEIDPRDHIFLEAVKNDDYIGLNNLHKEGYIPSEEVLERADIKEQEFKKIAVEQIFDLNSEPKIKGKLIEVKDDNKKDNTKQNNINHIKQAANNLFGGGM